MALLDAREAADPWGNEYGYRLVNGRPVTFCLGRDGIPGGEDEDRDYEFAAGALKKIQGGEEP